MSTIETESGTERTTARQPEREVVVTRTFDAARELVFRMWTEPEHLARWWGPKGFTNPVCELDARPERIVFTAIVEDAQGNPALDETTTVTFAAEGRKTRVTVRTSAVSLVPS